ncbi:MAG: hypothetical protein EBR02_00480 [Alphaproteobacteria bacterium]|nr:hypothetical protein [Alphaproteobacteria bacterium]
MSIISSLSSIANSTQTNAAQANKRLFAAIAQLVSGSAQNAASDDVAALSLATQLQSQVSNIKQVSVNLAQAGSLAEVASGGISQIGDVLTKLQSLAQQASSGELNDENRAALNEQFQGLVESIDQVVAQTTFGGKNLLDGSLTGENAISFSSLFGGSGSDNTEGLSLDSLSSKTLLGNTPLDISTAAGAGSALSAIAGATAKVGTAQASVGDFAQAVEYAGANVDSALFNQDAARAYLNDADFAAGATGFSLANLQNNAGIALAAQTNRLAPSMLELLK